jgi:hypothetical protein
MISTDIEPGKEFCGNVRLFCKSAYRDWAGKCVGTDDAYRFSAEGLAGTLKQIQIQLDDICARLGRGERPPYRFGEITWE